MLNLKDLIDAGVQFGHQTWRWAPNMRQYIWGKKDGIHLIDVSKTASQTEKAVEFLESVAAQGRQILWVGTKRPAQNIIKEMGERFKSPYSTHRWVGGTLTNHSQVKKSVAKLLHLEEVIAKAGTDEHQMYTKKELGTFQKVVARLHASVGGLINLRWPVGAVVVVDTKKEATAIKEAAVMGIPVIALVDTNSSPEGVSIVIPANDDIERSIRLIVEELAGAVARGQEAAKKKKAEASAESAKTEKVSSEDSGDEDDSTKTRKATRTRRATTTRRSSAPKKEDGDVKERVDSKAAEKKKSASKSAPKASAEVNTPADTKKTVKKASTKEEAVAESSK